MNALKSGATSNKFEFDDDPEYRHRLRQFNLDLQPEGRVQGECVAQMVKCIMMTERVLPAGHAPDSGREAAPKEAPERVYRFMPAAS